MRIFKTLVPLILIILLFVSCASGSPKPSARVTSTPSKSAQPTVSETPSESPSVSPSESPSAEISEDSDYTEAPPVDPDTDGYGIIPGSLPVLTAADKKTFNPNKVYSYLAKDGVLSSKDYYYDIDKAQIRNGELYIFTTLEITLADVNEAYKDLKAKYSLSDADILKIPSFSDCVIKKGVMYADKSAYEDRQEFTSYEDWQDDNNGFSNTMDSVKKFSSSEPFQVSGSAYIILYNFEGSGEYTKVPMERFKFFLLNVDNKTEAPDGSEYSLSFIYLKYSGGKITAVYQGGGDA